MSVKSKKNKKELSNFTKNFIASIMMLFIIEIMISCLVITIKIGEKIPPILLVIICYFGMIPFGCFLLQLFGYAADAMGLEMTPTNSYLKKLLQFKLSTNGYDDFLKKFEKKCKENNYSLEYESEENNLKIRIYTSKTEKLVKFITLIKTDAKTNKALNEAMRKAKNSYKKIFGNTKYKCKLRMLNILCVEKLTNKFLEYASLGAYEEYKTETLTFGIDFSDDTMYMDKGGMRYGNMGLYSYDDLKEETLKLIDARELIKKEKKKRISD